VQQQTVGPRFNESRIFEPNEMRVAKPFGALTLIPR
jgi:hypothetical protein